MKDKALFEKMDNTMYQQWTARKKTKRYSTILYVVLAILTAMVLRQIGGKLASVLRSAIYIGLFTIWGFSLRRRIIQPQVRRYLTAIPLLMVFWITVRLIRFSFTETPWVLRHLWYMYYLPMLFIPLLSVFISMSLGKPESFRLPRWTTFLYLPTAAFLLLVLTNDFHQFVFVFPADATVWINDYRYAVGYYLVVGWLILCTLTALFVMVGKCRIPNSRGIFLLPFVPVILAVVYGILYIFCMSWLKPLAGDMTVVFCLLITAILESCIQCGLIQSNTGYDELFLVSRLGAQITDQENNVRLTSYNAQELTEEQRISAETQTVLADKSMLIRSKPIRFGHVLWQVDIAEITDSIEQIEENCRDLAERNRIRQKNLETRKKILVLQEKNRVNDLIHRETASQIDLIDRMLTEYDAETDERKCRRFLGEIAVIGAYIKRYGNLLLIGERTEKADIRELSRCFEESFINLELLGVNCLQTFPVGISLETKDMLQVYHGFETAVETSLSDLQHVWINVRESKEEVLLNMEFVCDTDLSHLSAMANAFSFEDGTYRFTFKLKRDGEKR